MIWGTDAVHGHNNVYGATLFPHNIGLGAAHDPDLVARIGHATAEQVRATGITWAFAPTLAVVQNPRWGRTYESYSSDPAQVRSYAQAMVGGLQGQPGSPTSVVATAKHWLGDGGTFHGQDQGQTRTSEAELIRIHAAGFYGALKGGAQTVMASYASWTDTAANRPWGKMHGNALPDLRRAQAAARIRRLRGVRLERHRAGARLHQMALPAGDQRRHRPGHGARRLEGSSSPTP